MKLLKQTSLNETLNSLIREYEVQNFFINCLNIAFIDKLFLTIKKEISKATEISNKILLKLVGH